MTAQTPPTPPIPMVGVSAVVRWTILDRLMATVESLASIAETYSDTQACLNDAIQAAEMRGYRMAMKDVTDAHQLYVAAAIDHRSRGGFTRG